MIDIEMEQIDNGDTEEIQVSYNGAPVYYISLMDGSISLVDYDINDVNQAKTVTSLVEAGVDVETYSNRWVSVKVI
jgi:hypothetical protein